MAAVAAELTGRVALTGWNEARAWIIMGHFHVTMWVD